MYVKLGSGNQAIGVNTVFCLGRNYVEHAKEMGSEVPEEPVIFLKPATSVCDGSKPIHLPEMKSEIHYEAELVVLMDDVPSHVSEENADRYIMGYGVGLDLTARDIQQKAKKAGLPWALAKGFDNSAPVSAFIEREDARITDDTPVRLLLNGTVRQHGLIGSMIFPIPRIIAFLSRFFTIRRGDLIFTGTPQGVGPLKPNDILEVSLGDIVSFSTTVQRI